MHSSLARLTRRTKAARTTLGIARTVLAQDGFKGISTTLLHRITGRARDAEAQGRTAEMRFWNSYFATKGLQWRTNYKERLDPNSPLQHRVASLLPDRPDIRILDVGAGPLTYLGKVLAGRRLNITAVDPLAAEYAQLLVRYSVQPPVRTETLQAEELTSRFGPASFDLVFARNCIDHARDPLRAVAEMIKVVKSGCYVLMEHYADEAKREGYRGFHQWNFSCDKATGSFLIRSKNSTFNISMAYRDTCDVDCESREDDGEDWVFVRIRKK